MLAYEEEKRIDWQVKIKTISKSNLRENEKKYKN
jgi:hypothetical protein